MTRLILSLAAALAIGSTASQAHHSISGIYDSSRRVTLEGVVSKFQLVNPHPFLFIDVPDESGKTRSWQLEMDNRLELAAIGVVATTFKPGDRVRVHGSLARFGDRSLYLLRLDRPGDGFWYEQVGATPRVGGPTR